MLKTNFNNFEESLNQLNICNRVLTNEIEALTGIHTQLGYDSGLEDEMVWLGKIIDNIEQTDYKIKSMIKVLNFAQIQYSQCEKTVANCCLNIETLNKNKYRLTAIEFNSPYTRLINWRKG